MTAHACQPILLRATAPHPDLGRTAASAAPPGGDAAAHQHRVVDHRVRRIDQVVQQLIIPCGRVSEPGPDGPILCPRTLPPPPLEVEVARERSSSRSIAPRVVGYRSSIGRTGWPFNHLGEPTPYGKRPRVVCASATRDTPRIVAAWRIVTFRSSAISRTW